MRTLLPLLLLVGCPPATPTSPPTEAGDLPTLFAESCVRHALEDGQWVPQPGYVRTSTWIYEQEGPNRVVALLNLSPIAESVSNDDLAGYPHTGFDPRVFGCGEDRITVELLLGSPVQVTETDGELHQELQVDDLQFVSAYYLLDGGPAGVVVLYANGQLISMVSA